jgi:hypothetical protein
VSLEEWVLTLAFLLTLSTNPPIGGPPPPWFGGRILTSSALHLGVRPAVYVDPQEVAVGMTVQLTTFW